MRDNSQATYPITSNKVKEPIITADDYTPADDELSLGSSLPLGTSLPLGISSAKNTEANRLKGPTNFKYALSLTTGLGN